MAVDRDILKELLETFLQEAFPLLDKMERLLLSLDKNEADVSLVQELFRAAHTVKGSSACVGLEDLSHYVHKIEDLFCSIIEKKVNFDENVSSLILKSIDVMREFLNCKRDGIDTSLNLENLQTEIKNLSGIDSENTKKNQKTKGKKKKTKDEVNSGFGIFEENLDPAFLEAEKLKQHEESNKKLEVENLIPFEPKQKLNKEPAVVQKVEDYITLPISKIETILNYFSEQVILQAAVDHMQKDISSNQEKLRRTTRQLSKITLMLQDSVLSLRMVSVKPLFQKMQRAVRDTATSLQKEVHFLTSGEDMELDKTLSDALAGPIMHIIRNAVDHGLENTEERIQKGKNPIGTVSIRAYYSGSFFVLEIKDDGKGLDREKILNKAISMGIVTENEKLTDDKIYDLIFHPGFSTKDQASAISGRGFGMDIVKSEITKAKGMVTIKTKPGDGSIFLLQIPMSVAIFNGMVVALDEIKCIIPNSEIKEVCHVKKLNFVHDAMGELLVEVADKIIPVIMTKKVLNFGNEVLEDKGIIIVINKNEKYFGLYVKEIIAQQRIVMKNLGKEMQDVAGIAGGAILADGSVAYIIKTDDIINKKTIHQSKLNPERLSL